MTIVVSAIVALTLTPMMASRFLRSHDEEKHGRLYKLSERGFHAMARGYGRGLDLVLRHRFVTLMSFIATVVATGYLFTIIPKGFFPQQDTGILFGVSEAGQDVSFAEMYRIQQELGAVVQADPAVATIAMGIGAGVGSPAQNNGRMFITLKPLADRDASAFEVIRRLRPKLAQVKGARLYLQAAQDVTVGGARRAHAVPIYDPGRQSRRTEPLGASNSRQAPVVTGIARRQYGPAGRRHDAAVDDRSRDGLAVRHPAATDRRHALRRVRPAAGRAVFHASQYLLRGRGGHTLASARSGDRSASIYIRSPATGQMVPLSAFTKWTTNPVAPLSISHQGQFPAITISFNLANGVALGPRRRPSRTPRRSCNCRARSRRRSRATRRLSRIRCRPCRC